MTLLFSVKMQFQNTWIVFWLCCKNYHTINFSNTLLTKDFKSVLRSRILRKILVEKLNLNILMKLQKVFDPIMSYLKPILDVDQWPIKADSSFGSHAWLGLQCTRVSHLAIFCFLLLQKRSLVYFQIGVPLKIRFLSWFNWSLWFLAFCWLHAMPAWGIK